MGSMMWILTASSPAMTSSEVEVVPAMMTSHARVSPHTTTTEKGLENAVRIHIMEPMTLPAIKILSTIIHSSLLFITKYGISLSNLLKLVFVIFLFSLSGSRVSIRMMHHRSLSVSFLDLLLVSILIHSQNLVIVFTFRLLKLQLCLL